MIKYIYADQLANFPKLKDSMFKDRAGQFKVRHGWDVTVDENGHEIDEYDAMNPLYAIRVAPDGTHGGSIRVLPTVGKTMVNDHFSGLTGMQIVSPVIWECTRFCISPRLKVGLSEVAASLILAGCELGIRFGLESSIGVVYSHTLPIYRRIGWAPEIKMPLMKKAGVPVTPNSEPSLISFLTFPSYFPESKQLLNSALFIPRLVAAVFKPFVANSF